MIQNEESASLGRLRSHLAAVPPGKIDDTTDLERLLAACWHELQGHDGGMEGHKLLGRMEDVSWNPPKLVFRIERHGGTALGSSRAELQQWQVDAAAGIATCETVGHRQARLMERRLNVEPLVKEIVGLILARQDDERLKWHEDGSVKVLVGKIIPEHSAVKQTLLGRRKRFREKLIERLEAEGWGLSSYPYTFSR